MVRLLNITTMVLEPDQPLEHVPPYAILSHTWSRGMDDEEPETLFKNWGPHIQQKLLAGMMDDTAPESWPINEPGRKVLGFCKNVRWLGLHYCWVDSLCINKNVGAAGPASLPVVQDDALFPGTPILSVMYPLPFPSAMPIYPLARIPFPGNRKEVEHGLINSSPPLSFPKL